MASSTGGYGEHVHIVVHKRVSQGFLDLFRFYWNTRTRRWGRHKGTSALELMTGNKHEHWLDMLGFPTPTAHTVGRATMPVPSDCPPDPSFRGRCLLLNVLSCGPSKRRNSGSCMYNNSGLVGGISGVFQAVGRSVLITLFGQVRGMRLSEQYLSCSAAMVTGLVTLAAGLVLTCAASGAGSVLTIASGGAAVALPATWWGVAGYAAIAAALGLGTIAVAIVGVVVAALSSVAAATFAGWIIAYNSHITREALSTKRQPALHLTSQQG